MPLDLLIPMCTTFCEQLPLNRAAPAHGPVKSPFHHSLSYDSRESSEVPHVQQLIRARFDGARVMEAEGAGWLLVSGSRSQHDEV